VRLDKLNSRIDVLTMSQTEISKATGDEHQKGVEARRQLNKMMRSVDYPDEREIDERIAVVEFRLWTDAISLKEEKAYLQKIVELKKKNRPKVSQVSEMQDAIENYDLGTDFKSETGRVSRGRVPRGAVLSCEV